SERKRTIRQRIEILLVGLPLLYAATFGPVCWFLRDGLGQVPTAYWPFGWLIENGPRPLADGLVWGATRGAAEGELVRLPTRPGGRDWLSVSGAATTPGQESGQ